MKIADEIREETMEFANFQHIIGLLKKDFDDKFIAKAFKMPIKKVQTHSRSGNILLKATTL